MVIDDAIGLVRGSPASGRGAGIHRLRRERGGAAPRRGQGLPPARAARPAARPDSRLGGGGRARDDRGRRGLGPARAGRAGLDGLLGPARPGHRTPRRSAMTAFLRLEQLVKRFDGTVAVDRRLARPRARRDLALLGPSGSGKTTTLRLLAGFETPDAGRVLVEDEDVTGLTPVSRRFGMVFQHYALFPHLDVRANVAFGLESLGVHGRRARPAGRARARAGGPRRIWRAPHRPALGRPAAARRARAGARAGATRAPARRAALATSTRPCGSGRAASCATSSTGSASPRCS